MTKQIQAFAVSLLAASGASAQQAVQWRVEDGGNGHWYQGMRAPQALSWSVARQRAEAMGGHLATATDAEEFQHIKLIAGAPELWTHRVGPWLGGYQDRTDPAYSEPLGGWRWVTGEPWYAQWIPGEPNNARGGEDYLHFISGNCPDPIPQRHWNDYPNEFSFDSCTPVPSSYIVEWSADCNEDGIVDYGQILVGQFDDFNRNGVPDRVCECLGDVDSDGIVSGSDLGILLAAWGAISGSSPADLDANGYVDGFDMAQVLAAWGSCR